MPDRLARPPRLETDDDRPRARLESSATPTQVPTTVSERAQTRRRLVWLSVAVAIVAVLGVVIGRPVTDAGQAPTAGGDASDQETPSASPTPAPLGNTYEDTSDDASAAEPTDDAGSSPEASDDAGSPEAAEDASTASGDTQTAGFDEGLVSLGEDVEPGRYVARVPKDSTGCYWERVEGVDARYTTTVAAGDGRPGARVVVELSDTDEGFQSNGCGGWAPYSPPKKPATDFGEGTWVVGQDITHGRYRSSGPGENGDSCAWARQVGFSNEFYDILESATVTEPVTVDIERSDSSFQSRGCGEWTLVE